MRWKCKRTAAALLILAIAAGKDRTINAATPRRADYQVQIVAEGMCCQGCARTISSQLYTVRDVRDVAADLQSRTLTVSLPRPTAAVLGRLWQAVDQADGSPSRLVTPLATYALVPSPADADSAPQTSRAADSVVLQIDNLHCRGCAQKIAAQLYALKGVTKVSVDMGKETLIVETRPGANLSPWLVIDAVAKAKERPLAVIGSHGRLSIEWATSARPKQHSHAQRTPTGGIQK